MRDASHLRGNFLREPCIKHDIVAGDLPMAKKAAAPKKTSAPKTVVPKYPRHSLEKVLRIPKAILDQNAGKECSDEDTATFLNIKYNRGPYALELSSAIKFGLLERPSPGRIAVSELAKKILRPQNEQEELIGLREAVLKAPEISAVYSHYRGENLPDMQFFDNALVDKFGIPKDKVPEFKTIFFDTLNKAKLIEEHNGKQRLLDVSGDLPGDSGSSAVMKKLEKSVTITAGDSCFVMMPFAAPLGNYYEKVYKPAIEKAGLKPVRADAEIFGTGKIMDQVWSGINAAKVLVAEMTTRNPNVFYELGLAHALKKPVVLISSNEGDVPFDLKHIRVIYYDVTDPFWGTKLLDKVAENILSASRTPRRPSSRVRTTKKFRMLNRASPGEWNLNY
jgi:hypothetical protein